MHIEDGGPINIKAIAANKTKQNLRDSVELVGYFAFLYNELQSFTKEME